MPDHHHITRRIDPDFPGIVNISLWVAFFEAIRDATPAIEELATGDRDIGAWRTRWRLDRAHLADADHDEQVRRRLEHIVWFWDHEPGHLEVRRVDCYHWGAGIPVSLFDGAPAIPAWDPAAETRDAYIRRVEAAVKASEPRFAKVYRPPQQPRRQREHDTFDRLEWLARRHLLDHAYDAIAADAKIGRSSVLRSCRRLASSLGLLL